MLSVVLIVLLFGDTFAKRGFGQEDQDWGYARVKDKAFMFWWLFYTSANVPKVTDRPLIIWLQGGPGASSTGYGNFKELGPLDINLHYRNNTWIQYCNVLFVDSPVGTGFSYQEDDNVYAKNNTEVALDFLNFLKIFYNTLPEFVSVPLYIFSESYGGKMTVEIALVLNKAAEKGDIRLNLKGIVLGDAWICPIDYVLTWASYLLNLGIVDQQGYNNITNAAMETQEAIQEKNYIKATNLWMHTQFVISSFTFNVDFYNILKYTNVTSDKELLTSLMNEKVKMVLNLTSSWKNINQQVFFNLQEDFMKPVVDLLEELLNSTDIVVNVYNGQLDLIVDTPGTVKWIEDIRFKNKELWEATERKVFTVMGRNEGFVKKQGHFALYWVNNAGHMVPQDNPSAMYYILKDVTNDFEV